MQNSQKNENNLTSNKPVIAVDCDGVILDFLKEWELVCRAVLKRTITSFNSDYKLNIRYGLTDKEMMRVWDEFYTGNHWQTIPAIAGSAEAIKKLVNLGYEVHVVTAIPKTLLFDRIFNLHKAGAPNLKVHCTEKSKKPKLIELNPVAFFDDHIDHIDEAAEIGIPHRIWLPSLETIDQHQSATLVSNNLLFAVNQMIDQGLLVQQKAEPEPQFPIKQRLAMS